MNEPQLSPVHPGEILWEDFLKPMQINPLTLANHLHLSPREINQILQGQRAITAEIALRLARFFGTSEDVWMNLQSYYDLEMAKRQWQAQIVQEVIPYGLCTGLMVG
jgi:addiction module HigA family antidote